MWREGVTLHVPVGGGSVAIRGCEVSAQLFGNGTETMRGLKRLREGRLTAGPLAHRSRRR